MIDWTQIVAEHGGVVWRTARRLLAHEADAADCFQRTFLGALELSRREAIRHWPALLRWLATARALEVLRERIRLRDRLGGDGVDGDSVDQQANRNGVGPDVAAEGSELAEHLRDALAEIDPRQAEVFCLACLDDCSYAEIGEQLGITAGNAGVILNRAKAALRERLRAHDPGNSLGRAERELEQ